MEYKMDINSLTEWFNSIEVDQAEAIKLDFAISIDRALKDSNLTRKAFAEKLQTSPAWVTKVLRGDVNLTIESMEKLCNAIGLNLEINVTKKQPKLVLENVVTHEEFLSYRRAIKGVYEYATGIATTVITGEYCHNNEFENAA
jgi:transcriptional regulator with XRE-family HTH domain